VTHEQHHHHHTSSKNFLVTLDLSEKISSLQTIGIKAPSEESGFIAGIQSELITALEEAFTGIANVVTIKMSDLAKDVLAHAYMSTATSDSLIVSTCHEFAEPVKGVTLEINRLIDHNGNTIGIGPRPGCPSLDDQLMLIKAHANGKPIVIVEDGIFTGSTARYVFELLNSAGITVSDIIVGFKFDNSSETVDYITSLGVNVEWLKEFDNLLDWIPDHDFLPMAPNNGLVIGSKTFGFPEPYYSRGGACYSVPYVFPFAPVDRWASIPTGAEVSLARKCLALSTRLYSTLDRYNNGKISIGEVIKAPQPVTIPVELGSKPLQWSKTEPVSSYLNRISRDKVFKLYSE
jgi:hypothetical protein